ncbi:10285_t:CDS:2 [Cetraspora pellucida]|uniref:10285_t:CDS:1 n=1 Tax=Cetraspora pellucida TaxID=1433469 RepID=A0A9N9EXR0_9GLOM|nr:10285_t:CDS:2 [Cetraspora pellucida]
MIVDLFQTTYEEPKSIKILRRCVIIISLGLFIAIFVILCLGVRDELPIINRSYKATNSMPIPGSHNCANFINKTTFDASQSKYLTAFLPNYSATSFTQFALTINITDPKYNISNQNDYMEMYAYDKEYDSKPLNQEQIQFEESLLLKNMHALITDVLSYFGRQRFIDIPYIESHMSTVTTANSDTRIVGGIWGGIAAFYIFLFGPGLISPWGFIQRTKLFRNQYEKNILPFVNEPDITEDFNSAIEKRLDNLEKRIKFYENYIIDNSMLSFTKKDVQPTSSS